MTKSFKIAVIIIALIFIVWGIDDFYHYATIGKEALEYYNGAQVIQKLVQNQFFQGCVKTLIGILIATTLFVIKKKK